MHKEITHRDGEVSRLRRGVTNLKGQHAPLRRGSRWLLRNTRRAFTLFSWLGTGQFARAGQALLPYYRRFVPSRIKAMVPVRLRDAIKRRLLKELERTQPKVMLQQDEARPLHGRPHIERAVSSMQGNAILVALRQRASSLATTMSPAVTRSTMHHVSTVHGRTHGKEW